MSSVRWTSQADEVQSAYFDKGMETLHPVVMFYKLDSDSELRHKSLVFVSDETAHYASTVYAFIQELMPHVKEHVPDATLVHYISDSPTSQYRNKHMMYIVSCHDNLFGIKAT